MPRSKLPDDRKLRPHTVKLTDPQYALIVARADAKRMDFSTYVREVLTGITVPPSLLKPPRFKAELAPIRSEAQQLHATAMAVLESHKGSPAAVAAFNQLRQAMLRWNSTISSLAGRRK